MKFLIWLELQATGKRSEAVRSNNNYSEKCFEYFFLLRESGRILKSKY